MEMVMQDVQTPNPTCWCCGSRVDMLYMIVANRVEWVFWNRFVSSMALDECLCADCTDIIADGGDAS